MAASGYHKGLKSTNPALEVKRAGKPWECCGVSLGSTDTEGVQDAWVSGRSRRCVGTIKQGELYLTNKLLPERVLRVLHSNVRTAWVDWPTCIMCAIEFYEDHLDGPVKVDNLVPLTPEEIEEMRQGLVDMFLDMREFKVAA